MRRGLALILLLSAAACASAPTPASAPPVRSASSGGDLVDLIGRAGQPDAPTIEAIERGLGTADVARREGAGAILTYRAESCALVLIFSSDGANVPRLALAQPRARRVGEAAPDLRACVEAAARRRAS